MRTWPMSAANTYSRISPSQYSGAETSTSAPPMLTRSMRERGLRAETIPTARPENSHSTAPPNTSESVAGRRPAIRLPTEAPL